MTIPSRKAASVRKFAWIAAGAAACMFAGATHAQETGVSHPDASVITADPDTPLTPPAYTAKRSAGIPAKPSSEEVYRPFVPYHAPGTPALSIRTAPVAAFDPDANIVTAETAGRADRTLLNAAANSADPDAGIVTAVPSRPGEVSEGTLVKVRLGETLSTLNTAAGTKFTARVTDPVLHDGKVIIPTGSMLEGRVTWIRGGKRIGGAAAIHLEPRAIILPDGGQYVLHARVIDTDNWDNTKVDNEGTVLRKEDGKKNLAVMGLSAGGPMAAGAVIGGLPGALIGAGVGAGVGTVIWLKQDRQTELPKDLGVVFSLTEPMSVIPMGAPVALPRTAPTAGD
jgi:hypothetical protein